MEASLFIEKYIALAPTRKEFEALGVNEEFINNELNSFKISQKKGINYTDPLLTLVKCYNMSKVNIGDIQFNNDCDDNDAYYFVGTLDGLDQLVIDKRSKTVEVLQEGSDYIMMACAENGDKFLDVLLVLAQYFMKSMLDQTIYDDLNYKTRIYNECINLAGGQQFSAFYKHMLMMD